MRAAATALVVLAAALALVSGCLDITPYPTVDSGLGCSPDAGDGGGCDAGGPVDASPAGDGGPG